MLVFVQVGYELLRLARIFTTTAVFHIVILQYADPSDLVRVFDTTFGTNIYSMSLGFFVSPDMHRYTQVIAITLIQHEDLASLKWIFKQLRIALNGGVDGNIVPGLTMTDGSGKLFMTIYEELIMYWGGDGVG